MENQGYDREKVESELNEWRKRIDLMYTQILNIREESKIDVLGDLQKMENHEAEIKNKLVKLNKEEEQWKDIETSIGDALIQIKDAYEKAKKKFNF
jgi:predicted  nucleic acid-binding Zn-ribbon protein